MVIRTNLLLISNIYMIVETINVSLVLPLVTCHNSKISCKRLYDKCEDETNENHPKELKEKEKQ
jgi:hypothetical protein